MGTFSQDPPIGEKDKFKDLLSGVLSACRVLLLAFPHFPYVSRIFRLDWYNQYQQQRTQTARFVSTSGRAFRSPGTVTGVMKVD